jgi:CheY-like chemotaxis protein
MKSLKIELIGLIVFIFPMSPQMLISQELNQVQVVVLQKWGFETVEVFEGLTSLKRLHHLEASHYIICDGNTDFINCYRACEQISLGKSVEQAILCNQVKDQYLQFLYFYYQDFMTEQGILKGYANKAFQRHLETLWQGDGYCLVSDMDDALWPLSEYDRVRYGTTICPIEFKWIILRDQDAVNQYANILNQLR